jgi:acyl-CoA dehydrogenase
MPSYPRNSPPWRRKLQEIAGIARANADLADREAQFPEDVFKALRHERLLAVALPRECGGGGCTLSEIAGMCDELGRACASSALIFAMHQVQALCLARHSRSAPHIASVVNEMAEAQWLIASATSEMGVNGDIRSSIAPVEIDDEGRFHLEKQCAAISYGAHADAILVTARRSSTAAPNDQVVAILKASDCTLQQTGVWDTLGFRATCSPPFTLRASAPTSQILADEFRVVASRTMVPASHILWSAAWLGLATDAVHIATRFTQETAKQHPVVSPYGSARLASAVADLQSLRALVSDAAHEYDTLNENAEEDYLRSLSYSVRLNNVKMVASTLVASICCECLRVCGLSGYSSSSSYSVSRHVRDALGAALMISNDRLIATNRELLLVCNASERSAADGRGI